MLITLCSLLKEAVVDEQMTHLEKNFPEDVSTKRLVVTQCRDFGFH